MTPSSNPLVMLVDVFRSPSACFLALYQRGAWGWQTYIVLMLSPFLFWGAYFDIVDFEWLRQGLSAQLAQTNPKQLELLDANTLMASEIISDVAGRTLTIVMLAFWFNLATKPSQHQHGFWRWFAASTVVVFPAIIGDLASYVSLLLKHGQVMVYAADLNSLNGLLKLPLTNEWSQFASSFPLLLPWYIALGYAAVGTWTEFERGQALAISALPWVAYYIIWALYIVIS
ncbi:membrane protein [Vibrio coralliilyticus]|uniref:Membrane protein n=1 Tax=Vibrio coralliilyticus TaxID=190893 RepID=A0A837G268_9VIBR|nr:YIP1 family protein [Vibrio coralliilyticus]AIU66053.1 membrane protein [Vibrio coralliilyticus]KJY75572.1 membrane protein [Vibrio coralliilyticus]NRF24771.1 YIP1 family protein [Vibrio coralliilyticus]NRF79203.1 YIP1 family protein [Vibrio coralliilyticus]QOU29029.1 YIP1 family protein [Vibrio coralliilyticus]